MMHDVAAKMEVQHLSVHYGGTPALKDVSLGVLGVQVTALIGPSGCGKSTLLRVLNRMSELRPDARHTGAVHLDGQDIFAPEVDVTALRRRVGLVFAKPNPFKMSVYENVAYGLRIAGERARSVLDGRVEEALRAAALGGWALGSADFARQLVKSSGRPASPRARGRPRRPAI